MKKAIFILVTVICLLPACKKEEKSEDTRRLDMVVAALKNTFKENGEPRYQINAKTNADADPGPASIRLILPGKSLAQIAYETGDKTLLPFVLNNFIWAEEHSSYIGKGLCFFTDESGAASVMLMTEMFYEKASGDQEYAHLKKPIIRCLKENFFDEEYGFKRIRSVNRPHPFYDGETWLALALYTDFFPQDRKTGDWVKVVDDVLIRSYRKKDYEIRRFFHWGAQAAAQRYKTTKDPKFLDFLKYMFAQIQRDMPVEKVEVNMNACSQSEGLADLIEVMDDAEVRQAALERYDRLMQGVHRLQIESMTLSDGSVMHPEMEKYIGLFYGHRDDYNIMPDTAQHCATALLKASRLKPYREYLKKKPKTASK